MARSRLLAAALVAPAALVPLIAQGTIVTNVAPGYDVTAVPLPNGGTYSGALGPHATDDNQIMFLYDNGAGITVASLNLTTLAVTDLFTDATGTLFAFPGGVAAASNAQWIVSDNGADAIYIATDADSSGTFEPSEVTTLLDLGVDVRLATGESNYTGSKVRVVTAGALANLQVGDFLIQTADSPNPSEVIVVGDRGTGLQLIPAPGATNEAYFRGVGDTLMVFDGGLGFSSTGTLIVGVSLLGDARIIAARDVGGDGQIDPATEARVLFEGAISGIGMFDLSATTTGELIAVSGGNIYRATITGGDPLSPAASLSAWAPIVETSSFFLGGGVLSTHVKPFEPGGDPAASGAFVFADFSGTELYVARPLAGASVADWSTLE